jgi:hypothetical protein
MLPKMSLDFGNFEMFGDRLYLPPLVTDININSLK